jgi:predicted Fe-Mo cluster-binding NifX family protein
MKIAAATNDGATIAADLERADYYAVLTIEERMIVERELRDKTPRGWYRVSGHAEHHGPVGAAPEAEVRPDMLVTPIDDADVVLAAGIDPASRGKLEDAGIWPVAVEPGPIDEAVQTFLAGQLVAG